MKRWFWVIGFAALGMGANPGLVQPLGDFLQGYGSGKFPKVRFAGRLEAETRSPKAQTHLRLIEDINVVRKQVISYEKKFPKDRDERLSRLIDLTRLHFMLGELGAKKHDKRKRKKYYKKGRHYAELLIKEYPQRVEGHYWLALNMLGQADVRRPRSALRMLPSVIKKLEVARDIDKAYDQAGPDRVLGCLYLKAPLWPISVGDLNKSLEALRAAVKIAPENSTNHLYLAETLLEMNKKEEAYQELQKVLSSTSHSVRTKGLEEDRQQALWMIIKYRQPGVVKNNPASANA